MYSKEEIHEQFGCLKIGLKGCSDYFFQYVRLNTPNLNGNSAVDYFYNEREDIIRLSENKDLLRTITWLNHSPAQFSPSFCCSMYKFFNAKSVFDPYAGWGDRCVAAMAMNVDYLGVDNNPDLVDPYFQMINEYKHDSKVDFVCGNSEEYDVDVLKYDLVFSSPPFYKPNGKIVEQYSNTEKDYQTFLQKSLIPVMKKFINHKIPICLYIPLNMYLDLKKVFGMANMIKIDKKRYMYCWNLKIEK